jgi:hypothetical protein
LICIQLKENGFKHAIAHFTCFFNVGLTIPLSNFFVISLAVFGLPRLLQRQ